MTINILRIFLSYIAFASLLIATQSYSANRLPFPDGLYAGSDIFCTMPQDEVIANAEQVGFLAYNIKDGNLFDASDPSGYKLGSVNIPEDESHEGSSRSQIENVQENGSTITYDIRTFEEETQIVSRASLERKGPTSFGFDVYTFHLCGPDGKFATTNSALQPVVNPSFVAAVPAELTISEITDLQWSLKLLGYYQGSIDGVLTEPTKSAYSAYQVANEPQNSTLDQAAIYKLGQRQRLTTVSEQAVHNPQFIKKAQSALTTIGFQGILVDGKLGEKPKAALLQFQRQYGFPATNKLDPFTYDRLLKAAQLWREVTNTEPGLAKHRYSASPLAFLHQAIRPRQLVGTTSIYTLGQSKELPSLTAPSTPQIATTPESNGTLPPAHKAETANSNTIADLADLPSELRFSIKKPIYQPKHVSLDSCSDIRGIGLFQESNHDPTSEKILFMHDVCISEEKRSFQYLNIKRDFLLKTDNEFGKRYKQSRGGVSFGICGGGCKYNFGTGKPSKLIGFSGFAIPASMGFNGVSRRGLNHHFFGFSHENRPQPQNIADGLYDISGVIQPALNAVQAGDVGTSGSVFSINAQVVVKDGIGILKSFKPSEDHLSKVFLRFNFNDPNDSILIAHSPNSLLSGYTDNTFTAIQSEINHLVPVFSDGDWGLIGAGNVNVISKNGAISSGQAKLLLSATPAKTSILEITGEVIDSTSTKHPYPDELKIPVKTKIYKPHWRNLAHCNAERGVLSLRTRSKNHELLGSLSLIDICYSVDNKTINYLNEQKNLVSVHRFYKDRLLSFSIQNDFGSLSVCFPGCDEFFYNHPVNKQGLSFLQSTLKVPDDFFSQSSGSRLEYGQAYGVGGGIFEPHWNNLDGRYQVKGSVFGSTVGSQIAGIMIVKNGVGRLENFDKKHIHKGLVDFLFDFKNYNQNRLKTYTKNEEIEGISERTYHHLRFDIEHMIALHAPGSIGIVGGGNGEVTYYGGRIKPDIGQMFLMATKIE